MEHIPDEAWFILFVLVGMGVVFIGLGVAMWLGGM